MSAASGLTVLTMAYTIGHISGAHLNPAVSLGLWAGGRFEGKDLIPYIVAQLPGGLRPGGRGRADPRLPGAHHGRHRQPRSTGPALFVSGWALAQLWLFWVAPIVGAVIGGVGYKVLFGKK